MGFGRGGGGASSERTEIAGALDLVPDVDDGWVAVEADRVSFGGVVVARLGRCVEEGLVVVCVRRPDCPWAWGTNAKRSRAESAHMERRLSRARAL